jgi:glyoxylase-like metal-dependent hydrolase (beta-lactamase superfamily II)
MGNTGSHCVQSVKLGWTRCYLLKCTDGYLLVDVYYPGYYAKFEKKLAKIGIAVSEIKYLFLTHHHKDHAGFTTELVQHTGCRVIVHRNALSALRQGKSEGIGKLANWRHQIGIALYSQYYELFHKDCTFPPVIPNDRDIVIDGDKSELLKEIGIDGVILHTPGHTSIRDSISILTSDGSAFVGDICMNFLQWMGVDHKPVYVDDINNIYESWRRLREQGAKTIYPSHGKPFSATELE